MCVWGGGGAGGGRFVSEEPIGISLVSPIKPILSEGRKARRPQAPKRPQTLNPKP